MVNFRDKKEVVTRSVSGLFGWDNHVVNPEDENVVRVVFPVDVTLDLEL